MCSKELKQFKERIKKDNRWPDNAKKFENERKELLFWFVDNCPSREGPEKAKSFDDYGIRNSSDYKKLKNRILQDVKLINKITYKFFENNELDNNIDDILNMYVSRHKAIIFFSKGAHGQMDSLYKRIRNSFAHGNYFKKNDYYILWNETSNGIKKLASFMMLKYDSLKEIYRALGQ